MTIRNARTQGMGPANIAGKAFAHPLRVRVLQHVAEHGTASPNEMHREFGEPLGNVSYHVKALVELGLLTLDDTAQRRGAIEHYYRLNRRRASAVFEPLRAIVDAIAPTSAAA